MKEGGYGLLHGCTCGGHCRPKTVQIVRIELFRLAVTIVGRTRVSKTKKEQLKIPIGSTFLPNKPIKSKRQAVSLIDGQVDTGYSFVALPARRSQLAVRGMESVTSAIDPGRRQR